MVARKDVVVAQRGALHTGDPVKDIVIVDWLVKHGHGRVLGLGRRGGGRGLREGVEDGVDGGRLRGLGRRRGGRGPEEVVVGGCGWRGGSGGSGAVPGGSRGRRGAGGRHGRSLPLRAEAEVAGQDALEVVHGGRDGRRIAGSGARAPGPGASCPLGIGSLEH